MSWKAGEMRQAPSAWKRTLDKSLLSLLLYSYLHTPRGVNSAKEAGSHVTTATHARWAMRHHRVSWPPSAIESIQLAPQDFNLKNAVSSASGGVKG
jgi:hypothetical protein